MERITEQQMNDTKISVLESVKDCPRVLNHDRINKSLENTKIRLMTEIYNGGESLKHWITRIFLECYTYQTLEVVNISDIFPLSTGSYVFGRLSEEICVYDYCELCKIYNGLENHVNELLKYYDENCLLKV
jgi:hypothetical protein